MAYDLTDELHRRLRASRPDAAHVDETAFDSDLLARLRGQPIGARRGIPGSVKLSVAGATLTAAAVLMLGGGPGDVAGPSSASAITQALHWLNPPAGTILHVRSVETIGAETITRELWQSADRASVERQLIDDGTHRYESSGDGLYDPATNTIYDATVPASKPGLDNHPLPAGDAVVAKVRYLLTQGRMTVTGPVLHDGADSWAISLKPDYGEPVWTLWVSADDGKPLELRDPGPNAARQQVIRWPTYEVLPGTDASQLLTLRGAHPSAALDHNPADAAELEQRLKPAP